MKQFIKKVARVIIEIAFPITFLSSLWLKLVRIIGVGPINNLVFRQLGILPLLDHYYEPLINPQKHLRKSLDSNRNLPGINFNDKEQLEILKSFNYNEELLSFPMKNSDVTVYCYENPSYSSGDAEYLYNMIRRFKPKRIIEVGSGHSTLMAKNAIDANLKENPEYSCRHICIEPYEMSWLEKVGVELIRKKVEDVELEFFGVLEERDILFIDSSHIIRPQGDVLFEYLEVLPILNSGVIVHVHDIFTPKDYPAEWIFDKHLLWNEQYILEAYLSNNHDYRIIGALNYLVHQHNEAFSSKCPVFSQQSGRQPGAFWMVRN
ncbi:MAG: class I SAM-dependent methyltransferase [Flavobacteriaceae bacterium]|nr:class I SAM-dependent methyltransferase [Bacteroidia bacterium]MBT8287798.1 class I SAM-dependent methyltransferase [Bacteroidia bacterium]NNF76218.1 class I SAM-dependent methyltransferase [Flavobacteriaceae bacterium]NNK72095.1 class I SAM-dependent methyltransferase [Flavobacteriaceae bacterium]